MRLTWPNPVLRDCRPFKNFSASCRGKQNVVSLWEPNYNSRLLRCPLNLGHLSELLCVHRLKVRLGVCVPFNFSFFFFLISQEVMIAMIRWFETNWRFLVKKFPEIIWRNIVSRIEYASFSSPVAHFGELVRILILSVFTRWTII